MCLIIFIYSGFMVNFYSIVLITVITVQTYAFEQYMYRTNLCTADLLFLKNCLGILYFV
jgi:hypothetical protein